MKKFKYCSLWIVEATIKENPIQWGTFKYLKDAKKQAIELAEFNGKVIGKNKFFTDKY
jgi:hypothetical protein